MNNITFFVFCAVKWFLWELTYANKCDTASYQVPGHVLLHHVIQSFHGTSSAVSCQDKCKDNSSCHSINWYRKTALCQLNSGTHLSYPEGLVPDSTGSYMLYSLHPMVTCSNKFCSHGDICVMEKDGTRYRCQRNVVATKAADTQDCTVEPLGMEDGRIKDSQITGSPYWHAPHYGRLHFASKAWVARQQAAGQYLQIDLNKKYSIRKVATQGRPDHDIWTTKYYLSYSQDGSSWESYKDGGIVKYFVGNTDKNSVVTQQLPSPIQARFIRFVGQAWNQYIAMRVEIYGCDIP